MEHVCNVVCVCCTLHNYCISNGNYVDAEEDAGERPSQTATQALQARAHATQTRRAEDREAKAIREALTKFLNH